MKHPSLSRKTAIIINILLLLILTILSSLGSNSLKREAQNSNNQIKSNIAKEEIIGNIDQSRIINARNLWNSIGFYRNL